MSFEVTPTEPLDKEIRRIAGEQLDKASAELREPAIDRHEAIHDVRKRAKKLRALIRLVRSGDEKLYRAQNARLRDLARALSGVRDRTALIEAVRDLGAALGGEGAPFGPILAALEARRQAALAGEGDLDATIGRTLDELGTVRARFEALAFSAPGAGIAMRGYGQNYGRARHALRVAEKSGAADDFHELRKRMKYLAHHLSLLQPLWPAAMQPLQAAAAQVGDDLGRDHDYAVLLAEIEADPEAFGPGAGRDTAIGLVRAHSAQLRARALVEARRLLLAKPRQARRHMAALRREAARGGKTPSV